MDVGQLPDGRSGAEILLSWVTPERYRIYMSTWKIRLAALVVAVCALLVISRGPHAVVNQIDGSLVPVQTGTCPGDLNGCIQTGLNYGEGLVSGVPPTGQPNPIDAILDAHTGPETFLVPQLAGSFVTVNFRLLMEGAGFENIFGWYNVGEPHIRFPAIPSCAFNSRSTYEPARKSGAIISGEYTFGIDFQAEFTAGRYKGKQIGFYLVTPEGSANRGGGVPSSRRNCATDPDDHGTLTSGGGLDDDSYDEGDGHDDDNGFGRIYYTESKLNNDGNYVHYLVYRSKLNSDHFYFGFEDLFRGGDNDYEDTFVKVEGLVPTCQPSSEVCNGVDDNCNGQADENVFRPCSSVCGPGQERCAFTNDGNPNNDWINCDAPLPTPEFCDGLDNDCNGQIDDGLLGSTCVSTEGCIGQSVCQGGTWVCDAPAKTAETCDGKDNDCDSVIDENLTRPCSNACGTGVESCDYKGPGDPNNWINCTAPTPTQEICNGKDDDCDGAVDNGLGGQVCLAPNACIGIRACEAGKWVCNAPKPQAEICDGKDNDCDGQIDNGVTRACSSACGLGQEICVFSNDGDPKNDWKSCSAPLPGVETCNGKDDDCDGAIDNNLPPGKPCTIGGCLGKEKCTGGTWVCDAPIPGEEICDGLDNNCDGQVDEGLKRSCATSCGFGSEVCTFTDDNDPTNDWSGCTAPQPSAEVCDGVDNDCNGAVDDAAGGGKLPGEGDPCDHPSGNTCKKGLTQCVGGTITCVGASQGFAEICDCKDNDCDGQIDEGSLCPGDTKCVACGCRIPCSGGEFGCPSGYACSSGYCIPDQCIGVSCKPNERCVDGQCVDPCAGVSCGADEVCQNGVCIGDNCYGKGCPAGEVCLKNACQPDPCAKVTCAAGEYCSSGTCKKSCGPALCGEGARCRDGVCEPDPCAGVSCASGIRCVEGKCDTDCTSKYCGTGRVCEKGACVDDPCVSVTCFGVGERCEEGQCISPSTFAGKRVELLAAGGGGLACSVGEASEGDLVAGLLPLTLLGLLAFWRRRPGLVEVQR